MTIQALARTLGGDVAGRDRIVCPGPGHSRHDRSLSVSFTGDDFRVHSFANDDWRLCRDHVAGLLGLPAFKADTLIIENKDNADRTAHALSIWAEAPPITGTPATVYLASRGLTYAGEALRWHPSCPFGKGERHGCMIGLVRNIVTNEPQAIHRTAIDATGRKIDRKAYGPIGGGAIKLAADEDVTLSLVIAEGVESSLSARLVPGLEATPVWSLISAGGVRAFPVLPGIETLWIAVDHDPAGVEAARECASRWSAAGREVIAITPRAERADLNDIARVGMTPAIPQKD